MSAYVIRRILAVVPVVFLVTMLVFLMLDLVPGDPVDALISQTQGGISPEVAASIREELGLNDPLPVRYVRWLSKAVRGDLGVSVSSNQSVAQSIIDRFPSTLQLTLAGIVVAIVLGFIIGTLAALNRSGPIDNIAMVIGMIGISMPSFWLGLLLLLAFSVNLGWFPVIDQGGIRALVLPAATLGIRATGVISRLVRSSLIDAMNEDYVRTARAKGLSEMRIVVSHALKNTLVPLTTIIGLQFGSLLGGAIVVETVFARRGLGQLLINGINFRDFPVVQGTVLFIALVYVLVNLAVDLLYGYLDPRIRFS